MVILYEKEYSFKIWLVGLNCAFFTGYIGESWFGGVEKR